MWKTTLWSKRPRDKSSGEHLWLIKELHLTWLVWSCSGMDEVTSVRVMMASNLRVRSRRRTMARCSASMKTQIIRVWFSDTRNNLHPVHWDHFASSSITGGWLEKPFCFFLFFFHFDLEPWFKHWFNWLRIRNAAAPQPLGQQLSVAAVSIWHGGEDRVPQWIICVNIQSSQHRAGAQSISPQLLPDD